MIFKQYLPGAVLVITSVVITFIVFSALLNASSWTLEHRWDMFWFFAVMNNIMVLWGAFLLSALKGTQSKSYWFFGMVAPLSVPAVTMSSIALFTSNPELFFDDVALCCGITAAVQYLMNFIMGNILYSLSSRQRMADTTTFT